MQEAKEALEVYQQFDHSVEQVWCGIQLAQLLHLDNQPNAAEEAILQSIDPLLDKGKQFSVSKCYHVLGNIYSQRVR